MNQFKKRNNPPYKPKLDMARAVESGIDQNFIEQVESFARSLSTSNSQLRNIFTAVKRIEEHGYDKEKFLMLKPRLAYAASRGRLGNLKEVLSPAIDTVEKAKDDDEREARFKRFCLCCEAIVGYAR